MKPLDPVERFVFEGLQQKLQKSFGCLSAWSTGTDDVRAVARLFNGTPVTYPYVTLKLTGSSLASDRQNLHAASFRGTRVRVSTDGNDGMLVRFLPVDFQVGARFVTNSFNEVLRIQSSWLFCVKDGRFSFDVSYGDTTFGINSVLEQQLSISPREANPDSIPEYLLESTMTVKGFISSPVVETQSIAKTAEVDAYLRTGNETVWKFPGGSNV